MLGNDGQMSRTSGLFRFKTCLMGVIPDNQDNELLKYPKREKLWETVKKWQFNNWSIANAWIQPSLR